MDAKLFKKLTDCTAVQSWRYFNRIVGVQLMGEDVFAVPFLEEAMNFDIGHVIVRADRGIMDIVKGTLSPCLSVGHLSKFVDAGHRHLVEDNEGMLHKDTSVDLNQSYEFHESDMRNGVKKSVIAELSGCEKWTMDMGPLENECPIDILNRGYVNINKLYLVTTVFLVNKIRLKLEIGPKQDGFQLSGRIPVGFCLTRYKIDENMTLGERKMCSPTSWKSYWIRSICAGPTDTPSGSSLSSSKKEDGDEQ